MVDTTGSIETNRLAELTYRELEHGLETDLTTAIIPIGATEQHGPHLPLGADSLIGEEIADRIAARLSGAVVAPPIPVGCSAEHVGFAGTISIPPSLLTQLLEAYASSLDRHGFEYVVLLPSHGGNFAPVDAAAAEIAPELETASLVPITDLQGYIDEMNRGLREAGVDYQESVSHAGATETSMLLAIDDDMVREAEYETGSEREISFAQVLAAGFQALTANGILGDPHHASDPAGERILECVVETFTTKIRSEIEHIDEIQ